VLALAADAGAFAALGGQDVGVAGVGVAPGQVGLQAAGEHGVVRVVRAAHDKVRNGPNCASIGLAHEAFTGVKHSRTLRLPAQVQMAGVLFADRLSKMT
jgi:hypothetical protein